MPNKSPKFNFSGIEHATNHYTWIKLTTFHSDPTYYWIFVGSQWILPLCPFFHHILYVHHCAFHFDPTIVGFYWDPTGPCHFVQFLHVFTCIYILKHVPILLRLFVYTNTTSFLTSNYLWKDHLHCSCIYIWDEWDVPFIWLISFTCTCIVMEHTCSSTFIYLHTCSKYGSPCR
jgi:hypothetical protein